MSAFNPTLTHNPRIPSNVPSDDDDPTSSSGSSDSESEVSSEDEDDDENPRLENPDPNVSSIGTSSLPSITGRQKPRIYKPKGNSDLMARLSAFLPQMKSANEELEKNIAEGKGEDLVLDSVGDGKDYIEMNLGLGVLEEKGGDGEDSNHNTDKKAQPSGFLSHQANGTGPSDDGDSDILGQLMGGTGNDEDADKPSIEEVHH